MTAPPPPDLAAARAILDNPASTSQSLSWVATHFPELRVTVAGHPGADLLLLCRLDAMGDPALSAAIDARPGVGLPPERVLDGALSDNPLGFSGSGFGGNAGAGSGTVRGAGPATPQAPGQPDRLGDGLGEAASDPALWLSEVGLQEFLPDAGVPPTATPPAQRRPRLRRGLVVALVAAACAIALAAIVVLPRWLSVPSLTPIPTGAPDFLRQPILSETYQLAEGLPAGVQLENLIGIEDNDVAIALLVLEQCEVEFCRDTRRWLRGVSLAEGLILWTLDIAQFGIDNPQVELLPDPATGHLALTVCDVIGPLPDMPDSPDQIEFPGVVAGVDFNTGEVLSQSLFTYVWTTEREFITPNLVAFVDDRLILTFTDSDNNFFVKAYLFDDLAEPDWTTVESNWALVYGFAGPVVVANQWIVTSSRILSLADGSRAPWGQDLSLAVGSYSAVAEDFFPTIDYQQTTDGSVFRVESTDLYSFECTLWDITTDRAKWPNPVACSSPVAYYVVAGDGVFYFSSDDEISNSDGEPNTHVTAVSAKDGSELWHTDHGTANLAWEAGVVVYPSILPDGANDWNSGELLAAQTGQLLMKLPLPSGGWFQPGQSVWYVRPSINTYLEAWPLAHPSDEPLWRLELSFSVDLTHIGEYLVVTDRTAATYQLLQ